MSPTKQSHGSFSVVLCLVFVRSNSVWQLIARSKTYSLRLQARSSNLALRVATSEICQVFARIAGCPLMHLVSCPLHIVMCFGIVSLISSQSGIHLYIYIYILHWWFRLVAWGCEPLVLAGKSAAPKSDPAKRPLQAIGRS